MDKILVAAATPMNVEFDPNERPRYEFLGPYNDQQRIALGDKTTCLLKLRAHHFGYKEHPFADELEGLLSML